MKTQGTAREGSEQRPRILCVDDEPDVLAGLHDVLYRSFDVQTATGGEDGLALLRQDPGGFAVVISDMRMPRMSGATFLREAKRVAPSAVRMLLTGYADADAAARAVNEGQIFRFLLKPCNEEHLNKACVAALWQHRVLIAERALLEQTVRGAVKSLTDVLALASPSAFGRATRVKRTVVRIAHQIGMDELWEVEVAALLAQIGAVTLPETTAERLYSGALLSPAEEAMVARVPAVSERILASIPRLDGVQQIVTALARGRDAERTPPVGARMLRIAIDYDALETQGLAPDGALAAMRGREGLYDAELLEALARAIGAGEPGVRVREIPLRGLDVGMALAADVRGGDGRLLVPRGHDVSPELVERLRN